MDPIEYTYFLKMLSSNEEDMEFPEKLWKWTAMFSGSFLSCLGYAYFCANLVGY